MDSQFGQLAQLCPSAAAAAAAAASGRPRVVADHRATILACKPSTAAAEWVGLAGPQVAPVHVCRQRVGFRALRASAHRPPVAGAVGSAFALRRARAQTHTH